MLLPEFADKRVLVVGDVMLDRYWQGSTSRVSPEAPIPIVAIEQRSDRPGGAGNVALNAAALGAAVTLVGIVGADDAGASLQQLLQQARVDTAFHTASDTPTTVKLRVTSRDQQLLRLDFEKTMMAVDQTWLQRVFAQHLQTADVVILSDYGKGVLANPAPLITAARARGIPVLVDPKRQDFLAYKGATLITPNQAEFLAAVGPCADEAAFLTAARRLCSAIDLEGLLVTRGKDGMQWMTAAGEVQHVKASVRDVYDVTGAGDTVIVLMALSIACGLSYDKAMLLANHAAGIVVQRFGAATVSRFELQHVLQQGFFSQKILPDVHAAAVWRAQCRERGQKMVFTNGCFDLLHAGHVHYLQQARALGECLCVGVNSDASVRRLKGTTRPIHTLQHRLAVLGALEMIDRLVVFSDDTPLALIEALQPDVLVKGGDYEVDAIVGAASVRQSGGEVRVLDVVPGLSSSAALEKLATVGLE